MRHLTTIAEHARTALIRILLKNQDALFVTGIIKARALPHGCELSDFLNWWPRVSEHDRDLWTVYEHKNMLTTTGRNQALTYLGSSTSTTLGFAQYFAVGNFGINTVSPGDSSVQGEFFRAVPNTITGTQVDISTFFGPTQGVGLITNAGLFGINATSTSGSGTLMTHALYNYTKPSGTPVTFDYLINLN